jgi:hypothetical protein
MFINFFLCFGVKNLLLKFVQAPETAPVCYVGTITDSYSASALLAILVGTGYPTFFVASFNEHPLLPTEQKL